MKSASGVLQRLFRVLFACILLLSLPFAMQAQPSNCVPAPSGLVSWWRAEGNPNDTAGGNNGTLNGSVTFVTGRVGQAFGFNGLNADVRVTASTSLNVGLGDGFTIETWISPASVAEQRPLIEWNNGAYGVNLWLQDTNSGGSSLSFNVTDTLQDHLLVTAPGTITAGSYQHVAATYDKASGTAVLYINGVVTAQSSVGSFTPRTIGDLYFGLRPAGPGAGFRFQGSMDEVSLYGRALSAAEIQAIHQAGSAGKCTGTSAPVIIVQPTNQTVAAGSDATFALTAWGTAPMSYQWLFHGTNLVAEANPVLVITNAQSSNEGPYFAVVTNLYGAATSAVATLTIRTQSVCAPLLPGLVGWWKAENNALDGFGPNNGTLAGNTTFGSGRAGQAFVFDGSGDGVSLGNPPELRLQDFTIEAWIKRADATRVSLDPWDSGAIFHYTWAGFAFALHDDGRLLLGKVGVSSVSSTLAVADTNDFHHVAVTKTGSSVVFYVDGVGQAAAPYNATFEFGGPVAIGARGGDLAASFLGAIDEIAFYNRALSAAELLAFYQAGAAGKCEPPCTPPPSGLVSWWRAETNALDSGNTNHGVLTGNATYGQGRVGQAFVLDGTGDAVSAGNPINLQLQDFSIEAWIQRASVSTASFSFGGGALFAYGQGGYSLGILDDGRLFLSRVGIDNTTLATGVSDTNFHHVAVTKSGSTVFFYIDGVAYAVPPYNTTYTFSTSAAIGARGDNSVNSFLGKIDELAVYDRPLTPAEIQAIYQAGSVGKCIEPSPPFITAQPADKTVVVGDNTAITVTAIGTTPLAYQWRFNETNLPGATNTTLTLNNVQFTNAGNYSVVATNLYGSATSSNAVLTVTDTPSCTQPPSGLISWWRAQGNALDAGSANGGVLIGNATYGAGRVGQGFVFDGDDDAVLLGAPASLQVQNFTVEAWIKRASLSIVSSDFNGGELLCWGSGGWVLGLKDDGTVFLGRVGISEINLLSSITDTNWHHVGVTKNGSTVVFYIDGVAHPVAAYNDTFTFNSNLAIGARGDTLANTFLGSIDELAVYNRALSGSEIQAIYNASIAGKCVVPIPPTIVAHPQNATVLAGGNTTFSVVAAGSVPLSYQWQFNGTDITNATTSTLTLNNVQLANAGSYSVVVTNVAGSVISSNAVLTVNLPTPVVRVGSTNVMGGTRFTLPVTLAANGNENALGFSLTYNTQRLALIDVELGSGASGATMLVNSSLVWTGRVGIALAYPPQATFAAGTQQVARLTFYSYPVTGPLPPSTIVFGDQPVLRELLNAQIQAITANYNNGTVTFQPTIFESDVAPRPNGNQAVSTSDWLQTARFVARLDTPAGGTEFQRADSAPRASLGDGQLKVTDWVQAGRNLGGLDPLLAIGGPSREVAPVLAGPSANRILRVTTTNVLQGEIATLSVLLDAQGDENAVGFTLGFDAAALSFAGATLGDDAASATLQANQLQVAAGRLGLALSLPTGTVFSPGTREILRLTFNAAGSSTGNFPLTINDQIVTRCVSDPLADELPVSFVNGAVAIDPLITNPQLTITQTGTNVMLSWPLAAANFTLQSLTATNGLAGNWTVTTGTKRTNGDIVLVTLPLTNQSQFFRLASP